MLKRRPGNVLGSDWSLPCKRCQILDFELKVSGAPTGHG